MCRSLRKEGSSRTSAIKSVPRNAKTYAQTEEALHGKIRKSPMSKPTASGRNVLRGQRPLEGLASYSKEHLEHILQAAGLSQYSGFEANVKNLARPN